jgi:hypothetical protein
MMDKKIIALYIFLVVITILAGIWGYYLNTLPERECICSTEGDFHNVWVATIAFFQGKNPWQADPKYNYTIEYMALGFIYNMPYATAVIIKTIVGIIISLLFVYYIHKETNTIMVYWLILSLVLSYIDIGNLNVDSEVGIAFYWAWKYRQRLFGYLFFLLIIYKPNDIPIIIIFYFIDIKQDRKVWIRKTIMMAGLMGLFIYFYWISQPYYAENIQYNYEHGAIPILLFFQYGHFIFYTFPIPIFLEMENIKTISDFKLRIKQILHNTVTDQKEANIIKNDVNFSNENDIEENNLTYSSDNS